MSTTGPKGPSDASAMARVLQFRRPDATTTQTQTAEIAPLKDVAGSETSPASLPAAVFDGTPGQGGHVSAPLEGAALSQLIARMKARGPSTEQSAAVAGPTIVTTSEGKVLSGSLQIEGKAGMQKVEGVVRVGGDLGIGGVLKSGDLLAMRDIKVVEGRFTFEGVRSKAILD